MLPWLFLHCPLPRWMPSFPFPVVRGRFAVMFEARKAVYPSWGNPDQIAWRVLRSKLRPESCRDLFLHLPPLRPLVLGWSSFFLVPASRRCSPSCPSRSLIDAAAPAAFRLVFRTDFSFSPCIRYRNPKSSPPLSIGVSEVSHLLSSFPQVHPFFLSPSILLPPLRGSVLHVCVELMVG